jgi:hypothetical protein
LGRSLEDKDDLSAQEISFGVLRTAQEMVASKWLGRGRNGHDKVE